jgi:hypothetical protein
VVPRSKTRPDTSSQRDIPSFISNRNTTSHENIAVAVILIVDLLGNQASNSKEAGFMNAVHILNVCIIKCHRQIKM